MSATEDEYTSRVEKDVEGWVESLVAKGTRTFKLTECKDKFMKEPISVLSAACETLIAAKKLSIDPTSRRIAAYLIEEVFCREVTDRIAQTKTEKVEAPPKKVRKIEEVTSATKEEEKKPKAAATAPAVKRQKLEAPLGVKKISSYFQVQATPRQPPATTEGSSSDETDATDENAAPPIRSTSASNLSALPRQAAASTAAPRKPSTHATTSRVDSAPVLRAFQIVDILPATPIVCGSSSSSAGGQEVSQETVDMVTRFLSAAFARHSGTVALDALVQDCLGEHAGDGGGLALDERGVQEALRQLEDRNAIMVDGGVIYEI